MLQKFLIALFWGFVTMVFVSAAQDTAFDRLAIGIKAGQSISENDFTQSWKPALGLQLALQTPFYAGMLEGGIRYTRFNNSREFPSYSDFHSTFIYLGWGYLFDIASKFSAGPFFYFGNTFLLYDEAKIYTEPGTSFIYDFDTKESEFSYELLLRNKYKLSKKWDLHVELAFNRTLTYNPLKLTFVTVGATWSFESPSWFEKVFK